MIRPIPPSSTECSRTSWTQVDPTTVEFKLKTGIKFSGGEPFDAECVKYNIDRLLGKLPELQAGHCWQSMFHDA